MVSTNDYLVINWLPSWLVSKKGVNKKNCSCMVSNILSVNHFECALYSLLMLRIAFCGMLVVWNNSGESYYLKENLVLACLLLGDFNATKQQLRLTRDSLCGKNIYTCIVITSALNYDLYVLVFPPFTNSYNSKWSYLDVMELDPDSVSACRSLCSYCRVASPSLKHVQSWQAAVCQCARCMTTQPANITHNYGCATELISNDLWACMARLTFVWTAG